MQLRFEDGTIIGCGKVASPEQVPTSNGGVMVKFGVKVDVDKNIMQSNGYPKAIFVNCVSFDLNACQIQQHDTIFFVGKIESRDYKGNIYENCKLDFFMIQSTVQSQGQPIPAGKALQSFENKVATMQQPTAYAQPVQPDFNQRMVEESALLLSEGDVPF